MIRLSVNFKKLLVTGMVLIGSLLFTNIYAQSLDFKSSVDSVKVSNAYQYNITITIIKGNAPFSFYLYDDEPLNNGKIIGRIESTNELSHTFNNLSSLKCYLCIIDNQKRIKGEWIRKN